MIHLPPMLGQKSKIQSSISQVRINTNPLTTLINEKHLICHSKIESG